MQVPWPVLVIETTAAVPDLVGSGSASVPCTMVTLRLEPWHADTDVFDPPDEPALDGAAVDGAPPAAELGTEVEAEVDGAAADVEVCTDAEVWAAGPLPALDDFALLEQADASKTAANTVAAAMDRVILIAPLLTSR